MNEPKNKSAVHLGRLSAEKRKERMGPKFNESMRELRKKGKQRTEPTQLENKKVIQQVISE